MWRARELLFSAKPNACKDELDKTKGTHFNFEQSTEHDRNDAEVSC